MCVFFFSFSDISVVLDPLVCVCVLHVNLQEVVFMWIAGLMFNYTWK